MDIPVTILGGYLGAGKTTLINHVLSLAHGVRVAVLVNDFGAVNIDARLIASRAEDTITLSNGCVCCTIQDDLGAAIDSQLRRTNPPQHIIIESSGVAEPARMLRYVESWPGLSRFGVVCVVDAESIRERAVDKFVGRVVARQIAAADLLVLNKADLVDAASMKAVVDWLARMAPQACIVKSSWGQVDPSLLLDSAPPNLNALDISAADAQPIPFVTATIPMRAHVDLDDLAGALANAPRPVHRIKGFVTDKATGRPMLVQCVGGRHSIEPCPDAIIRPPAVLVAIGVDRDDLEAVRTQLAAVAARHKTTLNETSRAGTGRPGPGVAADLGDH